MSIKSRTKQAWKWFKYALGTVVTVIGVIITGKLLMGWLQNFHGHSVKIKDFKSNGWKKHPDDAKKSVIKHPLNDREIDNELEKLNNSDIDNNS